MFIVERVVRGHRYLYLVESVREVKAVRKRTIKALGRKDALIASGELDRLAASIARHSERSLIFPASMPPASTARRIGGPLLFGRLWERLGMDDVLEELLCRAAGSDSPSSGPCSSPRCTGSSSPAPTGPATSWMADYSIPGPASFTASLLPRHGLARRRDRGKAEGALAPRCVKDVDRGEAVRAAPRPVHRPVAGVHGHDLAVVLRRRRRDLGKRGHSKDYRPDLKQMVLAVVIDAKGQPICTEMVPGNTADSTVLLPVVERLRQRFGIGRVCVVADRGMNSAATIAALEERKSTTSSARASARARRPRHRAE